MSSKKKSSSSEQKENANDVPLSPYERILACRSNPPGPPEYLVKLRDKSYQKSKWIPNEDLQKNPQTSSMLTRFIKNQREYPIDPPYYDPQYDIIDRIIRKKDRKYFVKWMGLGYEQATWEKTVTDEALEDFKHRQLQSHPLKSGDVNKLPSINVQQIVSYTFGDKTLESYQVATMNLLLTNFAKMKNTDIIDRYNSQLSISCAAFFEYILQNMKENNIQTNTRTTRRTRSQKTDDSEFSDGENAGECGPVLIVAPLTSTVKWYDAFRKIKNATTLNFTGTKEGRQVAVDNDFYHSEDRLKFHVLITTPDILSHNMDILSEIKWRIGIFDEANRLRNPQSKLTKVLQHFVIGTQIAFMQNAPNYFALKKLTDLLISKSTNPYITEDIKKAAQAVRTQIQPKVLKRKNQTSTEDEKETFSTYYIDCPLSITQKKILRNIIREAAKYVQKKAFIPLCQRILRICSHPFLLYSQEYLRNGVDLISSSTKLSTLEELLVEKASDPSIPAAAITNRILIMSDFSLMLDMIEDVATSHNIIYERIVSGSKEIQHENACVFLYNPKYCSISPALFELMNTIIVFDGDSYELEDLLRMKKPPNLHKVYKFQCRDCSEERLSRMCILNNVSIDEIQPSQCESICKLSALAAFSDKQVPDAKVLLSKATVVRNSFNPNEVLEEEFENCDFWSYLVDDQDMDKSQGELEYENTLVNSSEQEQTNHKWTCRERDQLLRGLRRFGFNRWKEMRIQTGLKISVKNVVTASRALIREMIRILGSGSGHAVSREFIKESSMLEDDESSDKEFINETCFSDNDFKSNLTNNVVYYLREIENIHFLGESVKDKSDVYEISLPHPSGQLPKWWKEEYDRFLVYGTWKYGLGCYEQFVEDSNQEIQKIFGPSTDPIDQKELTERVMKLADAIKRKQSVNQRGDASEKSQSKKDNAAYQPPSSNQSNSANQNSQSDDDFSSTPTSTSSNQSTQSTAASTGSSYSIGSRSRKPDINSSSYDDANYGSESSSKCTREERRDIYQFLNRYGVPEDSKGDPDYEAFARESHLIKSRTVDEVKSMVEDYLAKCQIPQEQGGNAPNTSSKINQRCAAMRQLREIMRNDELAPRIFEHVQHWRQLPKEWTPDHEYRYFREILHIGLVNDAYQDIIKNGDFEDAFKESPPPSFIFKDTIVMKRIKTIYAAMVDGNKTGAFDKPSKPSDGTKTKTNSTGVKSSKGGGTQINSDNLHVPKKSKVKLPPPDGYTIQSNKSLFPADRAIFDGRVVYPLNLGKGRVILNLGRVVPEQADFHTERYIFPVGYRVENMLPSAKEKGRSAKWVLEIQLEGGETEGEAPDPEEKLPAGSKLVFRCWMDGDEGGKVYSGATPNAAWSAALDDINSLLGDDEKKASMSGVDAFLLSNQAVTYLVQHMKGSKRCQKYKVKEAALPPDAQRMREWNQYAGVPFEGAPDTAVEGQTAAAREAPVAGKRGRSRKEKEEEEEEEEAEEEEEEEENGEEEEEQQPPQPKKRQAQKKEAKAKAKQPQPQQQQQPPGSTKRGGSAKKQKNNQPVGPNIPSNQIQQHTAKLPPSFPAVMPGQIMPGQFAMPQGSMMPGYMYPPILKANMMQPNMMQKNSSAKNLPPNFFLPQNVQGAMQQGFIPQPGFMQPAPIQNFMPKPNPINSQGMMQSQQVDQGQMQQQQQAQDQGAQQPKPPDQGFGGGNNPVSNQ